MKILALPKLKKNPIRNPITSRPVMNPLTKNPMGLGSALLFLAAGLGIGIAALYSTEKPKKKATPTPTPTPEPTPGPTPGPTPSTLSYNPRNVRQNLNGLGYTIKVDNSPISTNEQSIVKRFQQDYNALVSFLKSASPNQISQQLNLPMNLAGGLLELMGSKSTITADGRPGPRTTSALTTARTVNGQGIPWIQTADRAS